MNSRTYHIVVLPGDGIGPEVCREAVRVLEAAAAAYGFAVALAEHPAGGAAIDVAGDPMPESTLAACRAADAVLLGALGGPAWDAMEGSLRPEAGLLRLRQSLGVYANLRPVSVPSAAAGASPLRTEVVQGVDLLVVRELTGGIYFGRPAGITGAGNERAAANTMCYSWAEIDRVARTAFEWARRRRGSVTSVDKANVLDVSRLWREVVTELHEAEFQDVALQHLYVDNAAMQLVRAPLAFDVILTGNLFGDILSDLAATLPGSLGMLPSASIGGAVGLFEPVHGSAPDIAGKNAANPLAAILSVAMMLDTLGQSEAAGGIRGAVDGVLAAGIRTTDMCRPGDRSASTTDVGKGVAALIAEASRSGADATTRSGSPATSHAVANDAATTAKSVTPQN